MAIYFGVIIVLVIVLCFIFVSPIRGANFLEGAHIGVWLIIMRLKDCIGFGVISLMAGEQYMQGTRYIVKTTKMSSKV